LQMQSRDRIHRIGQEKPCTYIYLLVPGTVDVAAYRAAIGKEQAATALLRMLKQEKVEVYNGEIHQEDAS